MANPFVDFLNTLHNEKGSNQNAIAEMQVGSSWFTEMQVKRDIIEFLRKKIEAGKCVILTGHAGDGKTTLLAQVLQALGLHVSSLQSIGDISAPVSLHYVKDFSELKQDVQDDQLRACITREGASLLIANTGPLLNSFKRMLGNDCESRLLDAMDAPAGAVFQVSELHEAFILNIARVDNIDFVKPFLNNIIEARHWSACKECSCAGRCPILFNQMLVNTMHDRVESFIENCYTWLQEYDMRATIRQITAHLSFSVTGGLSCREILYRGIPEWRVMYLFSNLFFGACGAEDMKGAAQIRCIGLMKRAGFDRKNTPIDYVLNVREDVDKYFPKELSDVFDQTKIAPMRRQRILKRAYLFFGVNDALQDRIIQQSVFSEWFETWLGIRDGKKPTKKLRDEICQAINALFVGDSLSGEGNNINLTLRRNNEQISNVQVLRGRIAIDDVSLVGGKEETVHQGKARYRLELRSRDFIYPIRLPLLNYFAEIKNGVITTDIDPLLSNGIDNLKAQLLSAFSMDTDDGEVTLVYLDGSTWKKQTLTVSNHSIDH